VDPDQLEPGLVGQVAHNLPLGLDRLAAHRLAKPRFEYLAEPLRFLARGLGDARVVHEDIEPPELLLDLVEHGPHLGAVRDVSLHGVAPGLRGAHLLHGLPGRVQGQVIHDHARTLLREAQGDGAPEPRPAARDEGRPVLQFHGLTP
jgi:hypothetical protein